MLQILSQYFDSPTIIYISEYSTKIGTSLSKGTEKRNQRTYCNETSVLYLNLIVFSDIV